MRLRTLRPLCWRSSLWPGSPPARATPDNTPPHHPPRHAPASSVSSSPARAPPMPPPRTLRPPSRRPSPIRSPGPVAGPGAGNAELAIMVKPTSADPAVNYTLVCRDGVPAAESNHPRADAACAALKNNAALLSPAPRAKTGCAPNSTAARRRPR